MKCLPADALETAMVNNGGFWLRVTFMWKSEV